MGLAILAGVLGLAFSNIDNIAEFSGAGFTAKMKTQIQAVIDKETEQEETTEDKKVKGITDLEKTVIKALRNSRYTWRNLNGISKEISLTESQAWKILVTLMQKELVRTGNKNKTGEMIWSLTQEGFVYADKLA
jgi:predicted transcriptional regulator